MPVEVAALNYWPNAETFFKKAAQGNLIPVFRELTADLETPVSVFLKLCHTAPSFLLESVEGGEQVGRYSFIGTNPYLTLHALGSEAIIRERGGVKKKALSQGPGGTDPLHVIKELMSQYQVVRMPGLPRFFGGAVGYLAYDSARYFERLPTPERDELGLPDAIFLFTDTLVVFDHVQRRMKVVSNAIIDNNPILAYGEAQERIERIISALAQPLPNPT